MQEADLALGAWRLRARRNRGDRCAAEKRDELAPPHATPSDQRGCQSIRWLMPMLKQLLQRKSAEARQSVEGQALPLRRISKDFPARRVILQFPTRHWATG